MFANSVIVFKQIVVMFFIMMLGYYIFRKGIFNNETTKSLSGLLNRYVMPCTLIRSFQREFDPELMRTFFLTVVCAAMTFVISIGLARLIYRPGRRKTMQTAGYAPSLTNDGFMALRCCLRSLAQAASSWVPAHICCMAAVLWSYCVYELSHGREKITVRNIILNNPGLLAAIAGLALFASPVKLPEVLYSAVELVGDLNTPLAMICLGCFIAQVNFKECVADRSLWRLSALHMLVIPLAVMGILLFIPLDHIAKLVLLVGVAAPSAIASAMFSQVYGADFLYATRAIALTTILSVVTLPALIALMEVLMRVVP